MRKYLVIFIAAILLTALTGCGAKLPKFSDNILFSINAGAAGFGTRAECTDAEIIVYTDRSVKILMEDSDFSTIIEIGSVELSEDDYEQLAALADRKKIYHLKVEEELDATDGSSYHITLYDENDEVLITKGGYMPKNEEFLELYRSIHEIFALYDIDQIVEDHRKVLSSEETISFYSNSNEALSVSKANRVLPFLRNR